MSDTLYILISNLCYKCNIKNVHISMKSISRFFSFSLTASFALRSVSTFNSRLLIFRYLSRGIHYGLPRSRGRKNRSRISISIVHGVFGYVPYETLHCPLTHLRPFLVLLSSSVNRSRLVVCSILLSLSSCTLSSLSFFRSTIAERMNYRNECKERLMEIKNVSNKNTISL